MDTWPEHNHVLQRHFSTNKFPINAFSMLFSHPCHQELAKKEASTHHMNMATENRRLALLLPSNLYTAYSSAVLHSFLSTFSASSMWRSYSLQGGMKPNGGEFAVYSWCAFLHASGSLRKTAECSSQILKYRYRSWDDLVINYSLFCNCKFFRHDNWQFTVSRCHGTWYPWHLLTLRYLRNRKSF